jgi:hypothetical protein
MDTSTKREVRSVTYGELQPGDILVNTDLRVIDRGGIRNQRPRRGVVVSFQPVGSRESFASFAYADDRVRITRPRRRS